MKKIFDVLRISWHANERRVFLFDCIPRRGVKYQKTLKWVKPESKPKYHEGRSGDLVPIPALDQDAAYLPFINSKELEHCDEIVKKTFSLGQQLPSQELHLYKNMLVEKVKRHAYDNCSPEVRIARSTAQIRYYQKVMSQSSRRNGQLKRVLLEIIDKRKKQLRLLRLYDYKRFEWLLEKLDLEYRPPVPVLDSKITRKESLMRLARLKVEQVKEEQLSQLKKEFDEKKIPFLEKKLAKLKEIKEMEEKNNLSLTVTESDLEECIKKIEAVKLELTEKQKSGYRRKIHPYLLEPYDEELLWEKEKAGELIREEQELKKGREKNENSI